MPFEINPRVLSPSLIVLDGIGQFFLSESINLFQAHIATQIKIKRNVLFNLTKVPFIQVKACNAILMAFHDAKAVGIELMLCGFLDQRVKSLFAATAILQIVSYHEKESDAVASFGRSPTAAAASR